MDEVDEVDAGGRWTSGKLRKRMRELGRALMEAHAEGRADFNPLYVVSKAG